MTARTDSHACDTFPSPVQAKTDVDIIVMPILELLIDIEDKNMNQVYILMIILLMLSEDSAFAQNANGLILKDVPFYKARLIKNVRMDSVIVIVLLHVALYNVYSTHDIYLHTNTLATLANMAPTLSDMCPAACQRILHAMEKLYERLQYVTAKHQTESNEQLVAEIQLISDFLGIVLEVLNAVIVNNLTTNAMLVYCMLHKKECIERIQGNPQYREMTSNIGIVLHFFGDQVEKEIGANQHGLTAEKIQDALELAMRQWNSGILQASTDLKFSYEEGMCHDYNKNATYVLRI